MTITSDRTKSIQKPELGSYWLRGVTGDYCRVVAITNEYENTTFAMVLCENQAGKLHVWRLTAWYDRMMYYGMQPPEGTTWKPPMIRGDDE